MEEGREVVSHNSLHCIEYCTSVDFIKVHMYIHNYVRTYEYTMHKYQLHGCT